MPGGGGSGETNATSGTTSGAVGGSGMTSVTLDVSGLEPFNPKGEAHNLSQRWKKWKRAFSLYVTGKGVSNDAQKRALLLHVAGMDVQEIYFTLAGEGGDASFEATLKVLDDHFVPKANIPFERHLFRQISQGIGETVDQFVCRLRQRAATCDFGAGEDDYIRDQLIDKCYSSHLRRKFLEKEGTVTLDELLRVARSQEAVDRQLKQYSTDQADNQVNAVGGRLYGNKNPRKAKTCFSCGQEGHFSQDKKCPARGQTCRKCGETGHFKVKCPRLHQLSRTHSGSRGPESSRGGRGRGGRSAGGLGRGGRGGRETNLVTGRPSPGEEDKGDLATPGHSQRPDYAFSVEQVNDHKEQRSALVTLVIGGVNVPDVLIDSGASCNVMGQQTWELLKQKGINCESRKSAKELFAYGGTEPLPTLGTFTADVTLAGFGNGSNADFVVIEGDGRTLLGRETAEALNLLRIGPFQTNSVDGGRSDGDVREKYKHLFGGVGLLKGYELKLHIDESVKPVAQQVRRIPFGLREKVDAKLDELLELDIIEEVPEGPSGWISPLVVVPKSGGDVRVCVDMRRANEAIVRERHPIPTVEELLHDLNGSTVFSKIDLKWGFHQILLSEESRHITTFVTHRGLYRYKRLMFGVTSAPEKYQQIIRDVLRGCAGFANIADDLIVHGCDVEEHDKRLFAVLDRLSEVGLTVNGDKCEFRLSRLTFFGHELTSDGINPSEEKIAAIRDARSPKDASEVRSFMGLVQYSAKFMPDVASVAKPIQELTRKGIVFHWGKEQQTAFEELKRLITQTETLAYFKVGCRTRIIADASPVGLGAVLTQQQGEMWRVVSYASRSLTDVERRYSQTEKEALALVWACERFNMYVSGQSFELETDHKPLERVYSRTSKPCARIERWVLRLQGYDFKVVYRPGKTNIADALSRLNSLNQVDHGEDYDFVRAIAISCIPVALSPTEIEEASYFDEELTIVKSCVRSGDWDRCTLPSYAQVKDELCVYGELLLRGTRIVVPKLLRDRVVRLAHEGHQGIVKTKYRLRSKVWWPGMDKEVEKFCKVCHGCQVTSGFNPPEPMSRVLPPSAPWQDCGADLLGPLPTGESILVVIDYYSRFLEVAILKSTTSAKVIEALAPMFARFGFPFSLRTDNGPQFVSEEFEAYLRANGIEHRKTTPLWPQANGEVERQNRSLLKCLQIAHLEGKNWRTELLVWLMAYRSTPQTTTGTTPCYMMFGHEVRSKLPELRGETVGVPGEEVRERDWSSKLKGKAYADLKRGATPKSIRVGDTVLLKAEKTNKLSTNFNPAPFKVVQRTGTEVTLRSEAGVQVKRNTAFVKKYNDGVSNGNGDQVVEASSTVQTDEPGPSRVPETTEVSGPSGIPGATGVSENSQVQAGHSTEREDNAAERPVRRSTRTVRQPACYKDFVLDV